MNGVREEGKGGGKFSWKKKTCTNVVMIEVFFILFSYVVRRRERDEREMGFVCRYVGCFFNWVRSLVTDVLFIIGYYV